MIINEEKIKNAKQTMVDTIMVCSMIDAKSPLLQCYNEAYNVIKNCTTFSHMLTSLASYKENMVLLDSYTENDKIVIENIFETIKDEIKGTEEERLLKAINYLKE